MIVFLLNFDPVLLGSEQPLSPQIGRSEFPVWTESRSKPIGSLLDEFARLRAESLNTIASLRLDRDELAKVGRHPAIGRVTLSQLLATWAVHDLTHLHQVSRVMAYQYRDAVGPWINHLGVLVCNGHSK